MLNQRGLAMIEVIPVLTVFVLLVNFSIGFFGVIHSGILSSIAARNYAFETLRNRASYNYLRDTGGELQNRYLERGNRYHGIIADGGTNKKFQPAQREIKFTDVVTGAEFTTRPDQQALKGIKEAKKASETGAGEEGTSPVWIRTLYGICLTADCGDRS